MSGTTIFLLILAMAVLALADFSIKQSAGRISSSLGTLIYAGAALFIPLVWVIWTQRRDAIEVTASGVVWSVATGLLFSVFTGLLFLLFAAGANLSFAVPIVRAGGLTLAAVLGVFLLGEQLNTQHIVGLTLAVAGIVLLFTA